MTIKQRLVLKPGEWAEVEAEEKVELPKRKLKLKLEFGRDLIAIYTAFKEQVYTPKSVLYPSCGFDASPTRVFDNVTFVDTEKGNEQCIALLKENGFSAIKQDIRDYHPNEPHDLLILLNPSTPTEWASQHLIQGGYVLANNYHQNASWMHEHPKQFLLFGTADFIEKDRRKLDFRVEISRNLESIFEPVTNEEELKRFRPNYHLFLKKMFRSLSVNTQDFNAKGSFEEIWTRYREVMHEGMPNKRAPYMYIFVKK